MKATFNGETHKLTPLAFPKKGNPGHDGLYLVDELTEDKLECKVTGGGQWPLYTWVIAPNGKSYYFPKNVMPPTGTVVKFDEYANKPVAKQATAQPKPEQPVVEGVLLNVLTGVIETQQAYPEYLEKQLEASEVDPLEAAQQWVEGQAATRAAEKQPTIAAYLTPEPTKPKRTRVPKSAVTK